MGELAGFVPPALAGVTLVGLDVSEPVLVMGLVGAGVAEGAILGRFQSKVVVALFPAVTGWATATAAAAGIAWLAGMGGSSLLQAVGPMALTVAVPGWVIGLLAMGVLQSRRFTADPAATRRWTAVTALAWLVGVMIPVVALSLVPNAWPPAAHVLVGIMSAVAMGGAVGVITASTLFSLAKKEHDDRDRSNE